MTGKFSIGEKVKTKFFSGATEGTIVAIFNSYYVVEFVDKYNQPYTYSYQEHELVSAVSEIFITGKKCECGASFTAFPEHHAHWCPMWRPNE